MIFRYIDKIFKLVYYRCLFFCSWIITYIKFKFNGVEFKKNFVARGIPIINVNLKGKFTIGKHLSMNSGKYSNMIGRQQRCYFIVGKDAKLTIGNNVGISCTAIVCQNQIIIGDNVLIGGGVVIYDTDFHSLNPECRLLSPENIKRAPVEIKEAAFIGAHSIILKGVTIGKNSVIGAGSVVSKSIPDNEIWAGNPARVIRKTGD